MRTDQDRFNRVVSSGAGSVRVTCRPRGSELRDLTDGADGLNWLTPWFGVLGLVGWLLHLTVFHRTWVVSARPVVPGEQGIRLDDLRRAEAERTYAALVRHLESGGRLDGFTGIGEG